MNYSNRTSCGCNNSSIRTNQERCSCYDNEMEYQNEPKNNSCSKCNCNNQNSSNCACKKESHCINTNHSSCCNNNCCKCKNKCNCRIIKTCDGILIYFFDDIRK